MHALYVSCPCMDALYACLLCMPSMHAFYACRICPYMHPVRIRVYLKRVCVYVRKGFVRREIACKRMREQTHTHCRWALQQQLVLQASRQAMWRWWPRPRWRSMALPPSFPHSHHRLDQHRGHPSSRRYSVVDVWHRWGMKRMNVAQVGHKGMWHRWGMKRMNVAQVVTQVGHEAHECGIGGA